jgi:hypothetical protein
MPKRSLSWSIAAVASVIAIGGLAYASLHTLRTASTPQNEPPGTNVLSGTIHPHRLNEMRWADIAPTIAGVGTNLASVRTLIDAAQQITNAPAQYFGALLLLADGKSEDALNQFLTIAPAAIPPAWLYAPHRLHATLRPALADPYMPLLASARKANQLPPLVAARLHARAAQPRAALEAYLKTDPQDWAREDLLAFGGMLQHAGVAGETSRLIRAALRATRVSAELRPELAALLKSDDDPQALRELRDGLAEYLKRDPAARQVAVSSAIQQLALRQRFVRREYSSILEEHRGTDPLRLPEETVLLLTLAAARQGDALELERWSQEVKRRTPTQEVAQWIRDIRSTAR